MPQEFTSCLLGLGFLHICVVGADNLIGIDGSQLCKCIDPGLAGFAGNNISCPDPAFNILERVSGTPHCLSTDYGRQTCEQWDLKNNPTCSDTDGNALDDAPSWCDDSWCYVSPDCPMAKSRSVYFPNMPDLWFSYGTCGHANIFQEWTVASYLHGTPLRVRLMDESTYGYVYPQRKANDELGRGALWDVYGEIRKESGFKYILDNWTNSDADRSPYQTCVWDVTIGSIDMCMGTFWETQERMLNTSFVTPVGVDRFHLVVMINENENFGSHFVSAFKPFTWRLWICIFAVMGCVGVTLMVLEKREAGEDHEDFPDENVAGNVFRSIYLTCLGFWSSGPAHNPKTPAGKMVLCSFAMFIFFVLVGYTANLASFLMSHTITVSISGLDDIISQDLKVCVPATIRSFFLERYPELAPHVMSVVSGDLGYKKLDAGDCQAVLQGENFHRYQLLRKENCNKIMLDKTLMTAMLSQPVNVRFRRALSYWMVVMRSQSKLQEALTKYIPADECQGSDDTDVDILGKQFDGQMDMQDFLSTFSIVGFVGGLGLCFRFARMGREAMVVSDVAQIVREMQPLPCEVWNATSKNEPSSCASKDVPPAPVCSSRNWPEEV